MAGLACVLAGKGCGVVRLLKITKTPERSGEIFIVCHESCYDVAEMGRSDSKVILVRVMAQSRVLTEGKPESRGRSPKRSEQKHRELDAVNVPFARGDKVDGNDY